MLENNLIQLAFATLMWLYWIYWAVFVVRNQEYRRREEDASIEQILVATGWIVAVCFAYTFHIGMKKMLF